MYAYYFENITAGSSAVAVGICGIDGQASELSLDVTKVYIQRFYLFLGILQQTKN